MPYEILDVEPGSCPSGYVSTWPPTQLVLSPVGQGQRFGSGRDVLSLLSPFRAHGVSGTAIRPSTITRREEIAVRSGPALAEGA